MNLLRPFRGDDRFYRQIPQDFINVKKGRISAAAFQNTSGTREMSVDWAALTSATDCMARRPERAVAHFVKQLADDLSQICVYDPIPGNPAHCSIVGDKEEPVRAAFARAAKLVLWPDGFIVPNALRDDADTTN